MTKKIDKSQDLGTKTTYLCFNENHMVTTGKTKLWYVMNKRGECLGSIKWYGAFRGYCFYTDTTEVIYDHNCLREIWEFLYTVNTEHRMMLNRQRALKIEKALASK